jgi:hypothetical protein
MARTARTTELQTTPDMEAEILHADMRALDAVAVANQQQHNAARIVASQLGYQLPADCVDPDLIQRDIAANMRRSIEACLEVGKGLLVLKEACQHGAFMARLDVLGIEPRVAQRFMQAARKFSNATAPSLLKAAGNQAKLFELLVLDDEQIEELELTGQTNGLTIDDIGKMGFRELRKECRGLRDKVHALERLNDDKNKKIDEISTLKLSVSPWDEKVNTFKAAIGAHFDQLEQGVAQIHLFHGAILQEDTQWGGDDEQERLILRQFATLYGDRLRRLTQQFAELRDHYDATLSGWAAELDTRNLDLFQAGQGDDDDVGVSDVIGA